MNIIKIENIKTYIDRPIELSMKNSVRSTYTEKKKVLYETYESFELATKLKNSSVHNTELKGFDFFLVHFHLLNRIIHDLVNFNVNKIEDQRKKCLFFRKDWYNNY
jgi:hypothetical protein